MTTNERLRARENKDNSEYRDNTQRDNGIHREVRERREKNNKRRDIVLENESKRR